MQTPNQRWREIQRKAGRVPKLIWVDANEWLIVKSLLDKLKKLRKNPA